MATVFPAPYFKINALHQPSAGQGHNLLTPVSETSATVRPKIGGSRKRKARHGTRKITKHSRRSTKKSMRKRTQKGGFLPSIGEGFAALAAKYAAPIALYGLFRFMNKTRRRHRR